LPLLRIISVNDVYSLQSLPRLKTLVKERSSETVPTIVVCAGDFVAPSLLSSLDAGRGMVDCLNDVGVTYVVLGNHEDDIPTAELHKRVAELRATWLSSNVAFDDKMRASDIVTVGDVRVGLVGVVMTDPTVYRDAPFGGAPIEPANDTVRREAARLMREGCACVVPITHQPMQDDRTLADGGFPVIVGGHEHTPFLERIGGTWIVKAGSDATAAVITDLTWTDGVLSVRTKLEPVAGYAEDLELRARVDAHMAKVDELEHASLVMLPAGDTLSSVGSRARPTSLGTLLCTRIRDALGVDACLFNGGGIRGGREYRTHFTYGDLETEVPFENEIAVARMPGRIIGEAIAASRSRAPLETGAYLQTDDALDPSKLEGEREYRVALVRNLLTGMDHIEPLVKWATEHPEKIPPAGSGRDVKHVLVDAFAVELWRKLGGFDDIDLNHDGVITEPEVAAALVRVTAEAPSHVTAQLLVRAIDKNADNVISRAELDAVRDRET
jgi:2',3'-cyclic-nucleotide 2'-phosphodiesterase (5'-nucleotidase family)